MELVPENEAVPVPVPVPVSEVLGNNAESFDVKAEGSVNPVVEVYTKVPEVRQKVAQKKIVLTGWYKIFQRFDPFFTVTWLVSFSVLLIGFYLFFQHNQRLLDAHQSEIESGNREIREKIAANQSVVRKEAVSANAIPVLQQELAMPVQSQSTAATEKHIDQTAPGALSNDSAPVENLLDLRKLLEENTQQLEYLAAENHELRLRLEYGEGTLPADDVVIPEQDANSASYSATQESLTSELDQPVERSVAVGNEESDALIAKAQIAFEEQQHKTAAVLYNEALQIEPRNREINLGVAEVALATGNIALAVDRYRHLLTLNPDDQQVFRLMLGLSKEDGMVEIELRGHVLQHAGERSALFSIMGQYFGHNDAWSDARSYFTDAFESAESDQPLADILFNLGVSLEHLGLPQEALAHYLRALNADGVASFDRSLLQQRVQILQQSRLR